MRSKASGALLALGLALGTRGCTINAAGPGPTVGIPGAGLEPNVDRPGADYRSFDLVYPRPEDCQNACMSDAQCLAFTYVNPGVQGPNARCWLKNQVSPPVAAACCVSGAKFGGGQPPADNSSPWVGMPPTQPAAPAPLPEQAPPPGSPPSAWRGEPPPAAPAPAPSSLEVNFNRPGLDYRSFDLAYARPEDCRAACMAEPPCVAFTYVNPGVQGPNPRCWLKSGVPQPVADGCCISGVK